MLVLVRRVRFAGVLALEYRFGFLLCLNWKKGDLVLCLDWKSGDLLTECASYCGTDQVCQWKYQPRTIIASLEFLIHESIHLG